MKRILVCNLPRDNITVKVQVSVTDVSLTLAVTLAVTWLDEDDVEKVPVTWLFAAAAKVAPVALYVTWDTVPEPPVTVAAGKLIEPVDASHWYCPFWRAGQTIANGCGTVENN